MHAHLLISVRQYCKRLFRNIRTPQLIFWSKRVLNRPQNRWNNYCTFPHIIHCPHNYYWFWTKVRTNIRKADVVSVILSSGSIVQRTIWNLGSIVLGSRHPWRQKIICSMGRIKTICLKIKLTSEWLEIFICNFWLIRQSSINNRARASISTQKCFAYMLILFTIWGIALICCALKLFHVSRCAFEEFANY